MAVAGGMRFRVGGNRAPRWYPSIMSDALGPGRDLLRSDCYVGGIWVGADERFPVEDPSTGEVLARVPDLPDAVVDDALVAAARAFPAWRARPAHERAGFLARMAARMHDRERELGALITAENGKPLAEAVGEVRYAASFLEWFAGEAVRVYGETLPATRSDQRITVLREPVGPCAFITPWNFPAAMLTRKLGPALAAGCTVVAKPAEATPLTTLALAGIADELGLPAGVFNVVTGEAARVGGHLITSRWIRKISFTGSTEVGRLIQRAAADHLARVSLELGGNAPFLVFADADLDRAVAAALIAKFRNAGQSCVAANRFLVEGRVAGLFGEKLVAEIKKLVVADGRTPNASIGPLINRDAVAKVRRLVEDAIARGARLVHGAVPAADRQLVEPVVLAGITSDMPIWREEIFGPVVAMRTFATEAEAIALANDTEYGLVAYLCSRDASRQVRVAEALEVGMIGVNEGLISTAQAPFGGVKQSGYGREGSHHGLDDYTVYKYVNTRVEAA